MVTRNGSGKANSRADSEDENTSCDGSEVEVPSSQHEKIKSTGRNEASGSKYTEPKQQDDVREEINSMKDQLKDIRQLLLKQGQAIELSRQKGVQQTPIQTLEGEKEDFPALIPPQNPAPVQSTLLSWRDKAGHMDKIGSSKSCVDKGQQPAFEVNAVTEQQMVWQTEEEGAADADVRAATVQHGSSVSAADQKEDDQGGWTPVQPNRKENKPTAKLSCA
ncbi:unnamed protein product [Amaranthus hypochondriacus]